MVKNKLHTLPIIVLGLGILLAGCVALSKSTKKKYIYIEAGVVVEESIRVDTVPAAADSINLIE